MKRFTNGIQTLLAALVLCGTACLFVFVPGCKPTTLGKSLNTLFSSGGVAPTPTPTPTTPFTAVEISRVPQYGATYDNWVIKSGGKYIQFRCQGTWMAAQSEIRDRIWRSESLDGVSNW